MAGFKNFADGNVLTADELDGYLMRQAVMRFPTTTDRDANLASGIRETGMLAWCDDTKVMYVWNGSAWVSHASTQPGYILQTSYSGTTDASGFLTVTHGAGWTPAAAWAATTNPGGSFALFHGVDTVGATTLRLRFMNASVAGPLASSAVVGKLFMVHP